MCSSRYECASVCKCARVCKCVHVCASARKCVQVCASVHARVCFRLYFLSVIWRGAPRTDSRSSIPLLISLFACICCGFQALDGVLLVLPGSWRAKNLRWHRRSARPHQVHSRALLWREKVGTKKKKNVYCRLEMCGRRIYNKHDVSPLSINIYVQKKYKRMLLKTKIFKVRHTFYSPVHAHLSHKSAMLGLTTGTRRASSDPSSSKTSSRYSFKFILIAVCVFRTWWINVWLLFLIFIPHVCVNTWPRRLSGRLATVLSIPFARSNQDSASSMVGTNTQRQQLFISCEKPNCDHFDAVSILQHIYERTHLISYTLVLYVCSARHVCPCKVRSASPARCQHRQQSSRFFHRYGPIVTFDNLCAINLWLLFRMMPKSITHTPLTTAQKHT